MKHHRRPILKWTTDAGPVDTFDDLAVEAPLEVRVNKRSVSITLRTPGHDDELAAGFLLTEGVAAGRADLLGFPPVSRTDEGDVINALLAPGVDVDFDRLTRHVFTSSSCGMCGKGSLQNIHASFPPVTGDWTIDAQTILKLPDTLRAGQETFGRTGGLHAAGLFDLDGTLLVLREDVGRHNAVDKVLGRALLDGLLPLDRHVLMVSGRTSFEILQKARSAGLAMVCAVSAPSTLAAEFATESNQTLVGFLRDGRMNVYAHAQRVRFA